MAFNGRFVLNMAHLAAKQGADIPELIKLSGKTSEELANEDCIVDDVNYNKVVERIVEKTEDDLFGLHAGQHLNLSAAGLILQLVQSSGTIKQAYELCCEFANLGCSALPMELVPTDDGYKVLFTANQTWKNHSEVAFQHTALGVIAFKIKEFHSLTYMQQYPIKVHLGWKSKSNYAELEHAFGCKVHFEKEEVAIYFKKEHIEALIITSNYGLLQTLIEHAEDLSRKKSNQLGFGAAVAQTVLNLVKPEFPTIEQVASHLNLSSRTLQRRLKEEGLSFKKIIEELKKDFALGYIKKPHLSISDIAYLLNYTELSAFTRSFKRWTGMSPVQYRNSKIKKGHS